MSRPKSSLKYVCSEWKTKPYTIFVPICISGLYLRPCIYVYDVLESCKTKKIQNLNAVWRSAARIWRWRFAKNVSSRTPSPLHKLIWHLTPVYNSKYLRQVQNHHWRSIGTNNTSSILHLMHAIHYVMIN